MSWLVQCSTGAKKKVSEMVEGFLLVIDGFSNENNMNILPLGSYGILIGMDLLEKHCAKLEFNNKFLQFLDDESKLQIVNGE